MKSSTAGSKPRLSSLIWRASPPGCAVQDPQHRVFAEDFGITDTRRSIRAPPTETLDAGRPAARAAGDVQFGRNLIRDSRGEPPPVSTACHLQHASTRYLMVRRVVRSKWMSPRALQRIVDRGVHSRTIGLLER